MSETMQEAVKKALDQLEKGFRKGGATRWHELLQEMEVEVALRLDLVEHEIARDNEA